MILHLRTTVDWLRDCGMCSYLDRIDIKAGPLFCCARVADGSLFCRKHLNMSQVRRPVDLSHLRLPPRPTIRWSHRQDPTNWDLS